MTDHQRSSHGHTPLDAAVGRRRVLQCLAWSGVGMAWSVTGGVPRLVAGETASQAAKAGGMVFGQISDSHIGFSKAPNPDPDATLQVALNGLREAQPSFLLHTGDVSHLSKPEEFDLAEQILGGSGLQIHYVPGEHDVPGGNPKAFFDRFTPHARRGWYSCDQAGVHFVALVNVLDFKAGGRGNLGAEQVRWLAADLEGRAASTPIVVFTHIPLWPVYPEWGWGTDDGEAALSLLKRFGSVTVLNGHVHQVLQKVEGNVTFHTAMSTAFPQPAPGQAAGPGPLQVPRDRLASVLGVSRIKRVGGNAAFAITDRPIALNTAQIEVPVVSIENYSFAPAALTVAAGTTVEWHNGDDDVHTVTSSAGTRLLNSPPLDTGERFSFTFATSGNYPYFCALHPHMQGTVVVQ